MRLLALDTSSVACSVAMQADGDIIERYEEKPREHTRLLLPMIESVLQEAGVALPDLDAIVLGNGPGSFIGMRIATSVAQGMAFGAGLRIIPVSSMAAVAGQVMAEHDASEVYVAQDAHMNEVYLGGYREASGVPLGLMAERLQSMGAIAEFQKAASGPRIAAGYGWQRYPELLSANREHISTVVDILHPRAKYLLGPAADAESVLPREVIPAYLRQEVAKKPAPAP